MQNLLGPTFRPFSMGRGNRPHSSGVYPAWNDSGEMRNEKVNVPVFLDVLGWVLSLCLFAMFLVGVAS